MRRLDLSRNALSDEANASVKMILAKCGGSLEVSCRDLPRGWFGVRRQRRVEFGASAGVPVRAPDGNCS